MCLLVASLALVEGSALWLMGVRYESETSIRTARVLDVSISADGRWGVAHVMLDRARLKQPLEYVLVLHDLQRLEQSMVLDVGRTDLTGAAISPSGEFIAYSPHDGTVRILRRERPGAPIQILRQSHDLLLMQLTWSPDGSRLAAVGRRTIYVWSPSSGELLYTLDYGRCAAPAICFSHDAQTLLTAGDDGKLRRWRDSTGQLLQTVEVCPTATSAVLSPDGRYAVFAANDRLFVWNTYPGELLWRSAPSAAREAPIAFSGGHALLAYIATRPSRDTAGGRIVLVDATTGQSKSILDPGAVHLEGLRFDPGGTLWAWNEQGDLTGWNVESGKPIGRYSYRTEISAALGDARWGDKVMRTPVCKQGSRPPYLESSCIGSRW